MSHWEFLRQHQLTQLIKQLITQLGFKLFSSGIRQWGSQDNGKTSCILPIAFSAQKFKSIGIHRGSNAVIVVELDDYSNSLTQTGFKTLDSNGSYIDYADVQWISIGK
ncbi:hypothetical protein AT798_04885 [Megasphaera sp. DJF_B143]|nr:hypothetical protein AT798_04885 [Megasphaera sp. DJF_B143]